MRIELLLLSLFVISFATHAVEASEPPSATTSQCLEISQTEPNEFSERFHRVKNACSYDVVIFYCVIRDAPVSQDFLPGDCRAGNKYQLAAFSHPLRDLGLINLEIPSSPKSATKVSAGWLPGHPPLAAYIIPAGDAFVSRTTSSAEGVPRSVIFPSACSSETYLSGKCRPDAIALFRQVGSPNTTDQAIQNLRLLGFSAQ